MQQTILNIGLFLALFLFVSAPVHECAHAFTAWRLGDGTAKLFGRVTLNPVPHFDPVGSLMIVLSSAVGFGIGWAKPTPVNPYNLRGRHAESIVAAAGPISNLGLAIIFAIIYRAIPDQAFGLNYYDRTIPGIVSLIALYGTELNVGLLVFNLIPVPPLDGSHVLLDFVDRRTSMQLRQVFDQYGFLLLLVLIVAGGGLLSRLSAPILTALLGVQFG